MLGLDRRAAQAAWTVLLVALLVAAVYAIRRTLVIFVLALLFAYLLAPVVSLVERFTPRRLSRGVALAIVYVLLVGILVSISVPVGSRIAEDAATLAGKLPEKIQKEDPLMRLPIPGWLEPLRAKITDALRAQVEELDKVVLPLLSKAGARIVAGLGNLISVVLIPILSFFFLKDGAAIRESIESLAEGHRALVRDIFDDVHVLLAQYIRALVILSVATFLFYLGFLALISVPYAILLAGVAAILEFIPVVGPLVASVVILLVAGLNGYPHLLWIVIFLVVYRVFQDYVLNPHLMSAGVEIHPLLVLFGVLAGEQIAGIPGMFFSVPVMAILRVIYVRVRKRPHVGY